jgi:hypothetical protein
MLLTAKSSARSRDLDMTRLDDELQAACAWGRWRIGQALNEPMPARTERRSHVHQHVRAMPPRARLRLVTNRRDTSETPR